MKSWMVLPTISAPMPFQMALDQHLFHDLEQAAEKRDPILRFYYSSEPWVSIGYSYQGEMNHGQKICRRITGGGRVEHGRDLIFSLIASKSSDESFRSVRMSYLKIHEAVKEALEKMSFKPRFYRCDENLPKGPDCFLFPIASDLAVGSRKIAGGSQKRSRGVLLHQESIQPIPGIDMETLTPLLRQSFQEKFAVQLIDDIIEPTLFDKIKETR